MTDRELMQQALDALEQYPIRVWGTEAIEALRARLAQPEQEPVAWMHPTSRDCVSTQSHSYKDAIPLYTAPQQREWQPLTDEEIDEINGFPMQLELSGLLNFARAIEAKLKEKNAPNL